MTYGMQTQCKQCGKIMDFIALILREPLCAECQEQVERDVDEALGLEADE